MIIRGTADWIHTLFAYVRIILQKININERNSQKHVQFFINFADGEMRILHTKNATVFVVKNT